MDKYTEEEIAFWKDVFSTFDVDGSGHVEKTELKSLLEAMGFYPTEEQVQEIITALDKDDDSKISFEEFMGVHAEKEQQYSGETVLGEAFDVLDKDKTGKIPVKRIKVVVTRLGNTLTAEEAEELCDLCDKDDNDLIDYRELITTLCKKNY